CCEGIESSYQQRADETVAADPQSRRKRFSFRQRKGGSVENDESGDPIRMPHRPGHADHATPVVDYEGDLFLQVQAAQQLFQIRNTAGKGIVVAVVTRLVGKTAADMIRDNAAM